jgi:hypothetical protein
MLRLAPQNLSQPQLKPSFFGGKRLKIEPLEGIAGVADECTEHI